MTTTRGITSEQMRRIVEWMAKGRQFREHRDGFVFDDGQTCCPATDANDTLAMLEATGLPYGIKRRMPSSFVYIDPDESSCSCCCDDWKIAACLAVFAWLDTQGTTQ